MYREVLEAEIPKRMLDSTCVTGITRAMQNIRTTYQRIEHSNKLPAINYNEKEYRYAYIYLYSVCHTNAVKECVETIASESATHFKKMMRYDRGDFRVCSLGGGPGCDVFGLLMTRLEKGKFGSVRICVVDLYGGWKTTLIKSTSVFFRIYSRPVDRHFIEADLRKDLPYSVIREIKDCDVLNLVKFVSAISNYYWRFPEKLEYIFNLLKPGAYVFFMDNSQGGFYEIVSDAAEKAGLQHAITPAITARSVEGNYLKNERFEHSPLSSTCVRFALWVKPPVRA